jgi:hypothetical protein
VKNGGWNYFAFLLSASIRNEGTEKALFYPLSSCTHGERKEA